MVSASFTFLRFLCKQVIIVSAILIIFVGLSISAIRLLLPLTSDGIEASYFGTLITIAKVTANRSGPDLRLYLNEVHLNRWFEMDSTNQLSAATRIGRKLLNHPINIKQIIVTWHGSQLWLSLHGININNVLVARRVIININIARFASNIVNGKDWRPLLLQQGSITFDPIQIEVLSAFLTDNANQALPTFSADDKSSSIAQGIAILKTMQPRGQLNQLQLTMRDGKVTVYGKFHELSLNRWEGIPTLKGISGEFQGNDKDGILDIAAKNSTLHFEDYLQAPIELNKLSGQVQWKARPNRLELLSDRLLATNNDIETYTRFRFISFSEGSPFLDLHTHFVKANVSTISGYLPKAVMDDELFAWLNMALKKGQIRDGNALVYGFLWDFPFINNNGRFYVDCEIDDMTLNYQKGWPPLQDFTANLRFFADSMEISGNQGMLNNAKLIRVNAKIDSLSDPSPLQLSGYIQGSTQDTVRFFTDLAKSSTFAKYLAKAKVKTMGKSNIEIDNLTIPFDEDPITVKGKINLVDNSWLFTEDKLNLQQLNGELHFVDVDIPDDHSKYRVDIKINNFSFVIPDTDLDFTKINGKGVINIDGFRSGDITARLFDSTTTVRITPEKRATNVDISGNIAIPRLAKMLNVATIENFAKGETDWISRIRIPNFGSTEVNSVLFSSNLNGISVSLPVPLAKQAAEERPLVIKTDFNDNEKQITIDYGKQLRGLVKLKKTTVGWGFDAASIRFDNENPVLPLSGSLSIEGDLSKISLNPWFEFISQIDTNEAWQFPFKEVKVHLKEFVIMGQHFMDTTMRIKQEKDNWNALLDGKDVAGTIAFPQKDGGSKPIKVALAHLYLQKLANPDSIDPITSAKVDPRVIPPLSVIIRRLSYDELKLGSFEFVLFETKEKNGLNIDSLRLLSSEFDLAVNGHWIVIDGKEKTDLNGILKSEDPGGTLKKFGYHSGIQKGKTNVEFDVFWQGGPFDFSKKALGGTIKAKMEKGHFQKIDPGLGRTFGLLSVDAFFNRRLLGDNSDLLESSGLSFDNINSKFTIAEGETRAHGKLTFDGPAVLIEATGETELEQETYDLTVVVSPKVAQSAPLFFVPFGPGAVAITFLGEKIIGKTVNKASGYQYSIRGPWKSPKIVEQLTIVKPFQELFEKSINTIKKIGQESTSQPAKTSPPSADMDVE